MASISVIFAWNNGSAKTIDRFGEHLAVAAKRAGLRLSWIHHSINDVQIHIDAVYSYHGTSSIAQKSNAAHKT
jgi:hypothetical protein